MLKKLLVSILFVMLCLPMTSQMMKAEENSQEIVTRGALIPYSKKFYPRSDCYVEVTGSYERINNVAQNIRVSYTVQNSLVTVSGAYAHQNGANIYVEVYYYVYGDSNLHCYSFNA